jgi:hypothetical protein
MKTTLTVQIIFAIIVVAFMLVTVSKMNNLEIGLKNLESKLDRRIENIEEALTDQSLSYQIDRIAERKKCEEVGGKYESDVHFVKDKTVYSGLKDVHYPAGPYMVFRDILNTSTQRREGKCMKTVDLFK